MKRERVNAQRIRGGRGVLFAGKVIALLAGLAVSSPGALFEAPSSLESSSKGQPAAQVNGVGIPRGQVDQMVRQMLAGQRRPIPAGRLEEIRKESASQALDYLIGRELLAQEAAKQGIQISRDELNGMIDDLRDSLPEGRTLEGLLRSQGITLEILENNIIRELRIKRLIEKIGSDISPPDEDVIADFYEKNAAQFDMPETIRVQHILVGIMDSDNKEVRNVRRRKAEALRRQVMDGQDFARLAMLHSDDASRSQGGEVGFVSRDRIQPSLAEAAFELEDNEISEVIESPAGYHVLQVLEHRPPRRVPLNEAQDQIRAFLSEQAREAKVNALVETLRENADIEILR